MSRWIEEGNKDGERYLLETLADPEGCAHCINDVCCNERCEFLGEELFSDVCESCLLFEAESPTMVENLRYGIKHITISKEALS